MENRTRKIEKLNNLISKLEGNTNIPTTKKKSLKDTKLKLLSIDPGYDIGAPLKSLNSRDKKEFIASFLSENYIKPFLIKILKRF